MHRLPTPVPIYRTLHLRGPGRASHGVHQQRLVRRSARSCMLYIMETIASALIIGLTAVLIWWYSGQEGYRNRVMVRVVLGALLLYVIFTLF